MCTNDADQFALWGTDDIAPAAPAEGDRCSQQSWVVNRVLHAVAAGEIHLHAALGTDVFALEDPRCRIEQHTAGWDLASGVITADDVPTVRQLVALGLVRLGDHRKIRTGRYVRTVRVFELTAAGRRALSRWSRLVDPFLGPTHGRFGR